MQEEPLAPEELPRASTPEDIPDAQAGGAHPTAGDNEPGDQAEEDVPLIFFDKEGFNCYLISAIPTDVLFKALPANWMLQHGLVTKRVYAHIRNSGIYPGFATGEYEGNRVVILSGTRMDAIEVHNTNRALTIPGRYLFPQRPSSAKGQAVVVTEGENAGEVYITHAQNANGQMPLVERGKARRGVKCYVERSRLAKCDPK